MRVEISTGSGWYSDMMAPFLGGKISSYARSVLRPKQEKSKDAYFSLLKPGKLISILIFTMASDRATVERT
jgi:hypothetical protein